MTTLAATTTEETTMAPTTTTHRWNDEFCSCGQDAVTCQIAGERTCGNLTIWIDGLGNVCHAHNDLRHPDTILARVTDPRLAGRR